MPELDSATQTTDVNAVSTAPADTTQAPASNESSTEQPKELEVVHEGLPVQGISDDVPVKEDTDGEQKSDDTREDADKTTDETKSEDQPQEGDKKRGYNARMREVLAENKALKEIIGADVKAKNPVVDPQEAIKNGVDENTARLDAMEQEKVVNEYSTMVSELNTDLNQQANEVEREWSFMNAEDPNRTPEEVQLQEAITDKWFRYANVEVAKDAKDNPYFVRADIPLYDFVKEEMRVSDIRSKQAETNGQRNTERKLAAVEIPTGRAPATDKSNDAQLSADEYRQKHNLQVIGG